jgi:quercetin dioxygenase-like cupin family protein
MKARFLPALACFSGALIAAAPADRKPASPSAPVHETVRPVSRELLPGGTQELIAVEVMLPPGAAALPHRHPAFVYAYVLSGTVESALENEKAKTYAAGQSWHEEPGALHRVTRNPSRTHAARLLAVFVAKAGETKLVQPTKGE